METKVSIEGAEFYAFHGYYKEERLAGNKFVVDASVTIKSFDSQEDNIGDTVNYEVIYNICKDEMSKTQKLLETVVFNIINKIKSLDHVSGGSIKLEKMGPQLGGRVKKAVVEMKF